MILARRVQPELLDSLGADDPQAQRSRRDLQRLNRVMATLSIVLRALDLAAPRPVPRSILELGAGDGTLMLRLAQSRAAHWPGVNVALLDRQDLIDARTLDGFHSIGWTPEVVTADVFDWLERPSAMHWDVVVANLFVHHFSVKQLSQLFAAISTRSRAFVCCEPRRAAVPLLASRLVGFIGANALTREDAILSVRAGFRNQEISALWPDPRNWRLREYPAGLFSHCFVAARLSQ